MGKNVYLNGQILPTEEAKISISDRGFLYGDGLIETIRTYKRVPFMLRSHLLRLLESAEDLSIRIDKDVDQLKQAIYDLIEANEETEEAVLRITLTRGNSKERSLYEKIEKGNLLITMSSLDLEAIAVAQNGVKVVLGEDKRGLFGKYKNTSMLATSMAYKQAIEEDAFDIIQITKRGFVTEASRCNVFVVLDGILLTPPISGQVLPGITRKLVINMAQRNDMRVEEDAIVAQDLNLAEEIFLTNSLLEIVPVTSFNDKLVGDGQKGLITGKMQNNYRMLVSNWLNQLFAKAH